MKLSIIIPVYNTVEHLSKCLDSIASQSFSDFEVLLTDDGSCDGSAEICDSYCARDPRFKVQHIPNGGVSNARNLALQRAQGEWILFIDSDDTIESNTLSIVEDAEDCDFVQFGYNKIYDGKLLYQSVLPAESITLSGEEYCTQRYYHSGICGYLIRRSLVVKYDITFPSHIRLGEDQVFILRVLLHATHCRVVNRHLYNYLDNPTSAMNRRWDFERIENFLLTIDEVLLRSRELGVELPSLHRYWLRRFAKSYLWQAAKLVDSRQSFKAIRARFNNFITSIRDYDFGLYRYNSTLLFVGLIMIYKLGLKR